MREQEKSTIFKLQDFEGPLDLLLFLIQKNEISIYEIPISSITDQYLGILEANTECDLESMSAFYALAATLIYIKSRMLLPLNPEDDDGFEDPRKILVDQLIEYQRYKKLAHLLGIREASSTTAHLMKRKLRHPPPPAQILFKETYTTAILVEIFTRLVKALGLERIIDIYEEVSIHEKYALIHEYLEKTSRFYYSDLVTRPGSHIDMICSLLALLDAALTKLVSINQPAFFEAIEIHAVGER